MKKYSFILVLATLLYLFPSFHLENLQIIQMNNFEKSDILFNQVKKTIETYYFDLEKCYDSSNYKEMKFEKYFSNPTNNQNCHLNSLVLFSNLEIKKANGNDLKEQNKKVVITFGEYKIVSSSEMTIKVVIEKKWNYIESPTIESGSIDEYNIDMDISNTSAPKIKRIERNNNQMSLEEEMSIYNICAYDLNNTEKNKEKIKKVVSTSSVSKSENFKLEEILASGSNSYNALASSTYNGSAAASYAQQWALSRNPNFFNFETLGGDCTNFTSQCLYYGGIPMHTGTSMSNNNWFYQSSSNRSSTWTVANNFKNYLTSSSSRISYYNGYFSNVRVGDLIQLVDANGKATHSLIVTGVVINDVTKGRSDVLISCHTQDRKNYSLKNYLSDKVYYRIIGGK